MIADAPVTLPEHYPAVLRLSHEGNQATTTGSAVLLEGGRYVLTAAHLVDGVKAGDVRLRSVELGALPSIQAVHIHPQWNSENYNNDIALLALSAPVTAINGLQLYQGPTLGQTFVKVGFGDGFYAPQHIGTNVWDSTGEILNAPYGRDVPNGSQLLYDYDNGEQQQNTLGQLPGSQSNAQPTQHETIALSGDSGGPALINNQVAGIASYIVADPRYDSDPSAPSTPGEIGADSSVAHYQSWLDYIMQGNPVYTPPTTPANVQTHITEPDYGSIINYFLLSVSQPQQQTINFWYQTVDGTATAGEDYIARSGWVTLTAGETTAAIPIEILGDQAVEEAESIVLQVSDPSGQWLNGEVLQASHIINASDLLL